LDPVAVLSVLVRAQGVGAVNAQLAGVQAMMVKTGKTSTGMNATIAKTAKYGAAALGIGLAYGLAKSAQKSAELEKKLDDLQAVSGATGKQMKQMKKEALEMGRTTKFSVMDVADAQVNLAKGGLQVSQIIGGALPAALSLAAAGDMELAEAGRTVVNSMGLFSLSGKDSMKVADMLATAANKTTADVNDFAFALRQGGSAAMVAGYSMNEAVTVLEALAKAGIRNADAGTSMKAAFIQLLSPSEQQIKMQKKLNLEFVTQEGTLKNGIQISKMLRKELGDKTKAQRADYLSVLAGTDGFRTLSSLYAMGPKKLRALSKANTEQGTAAEIAANKVDNLSGDTRKLMNSLEAAAVVAGDTFNPVMREVVQALTGTVNAAATADFGGMFDSVKGAGAGMDIGSGIDTGKLTSALSNVGSAIKWTVEKVIVPAFGVIGPLMKDQLGGVIKIISGIVNMLTSVLTGDFKGAFEGLKTIIGGQVQVFLAPFKALYGLIQGPLSGAFAALMTVLTPVGQWFVGAAGWVATAASNMVGFLGSLIPVKVAIEVIGTVAGWMGAQFTGVIGIAIPLFTGLANHIVNLAKVFSGVLGPVITFIGQVLKAVFIGSFRTAIAVLKILWNNIEGFGRVVGNVVGIISNLLRGDFGGAWRNVKELVLGVLKTIGGNFTGLWNLMKTVGSAGMNILKVVIGGGFTAIKNIVSNLGDSIPNIFKSAWDTVKNVFKGGANAVIGFIGEVIGVINLIPGIDDIDAPNKIGKQRGGPVRRQTGGIVPGSGTGDSFPMMGEAGAYVLNKKATEAYGLNRKLPHRRQEGGGVPLLLEPGERYFSKGEVDKIGRGRLERLNRNVQRFQTGGAVQQLSIGGGVADALGSAASAVGGVANDALGLALKPAEFFINKLPKPELPGIFAGVGPWVIEAVTDWIKQKVGIDVGADPSNASAYVTAVGKALQARGYQVGEHGAFGGTPTSGHADNSLHYSNRAIDVNADGWPGGEPAALDTLYTALQKIPHTELLWRVADHFDHLHYGLQKGGSIQKLLRGGAAEHRVVNNVGAYLMSNGFDFRATSGILGNAWREGLWNPKQREFGNSSNGGLYGFTTSPVSLSDMIAWAEDSGKNPWNEIIQTKFMLTHGDPPGLQLKSKLNANETIAESASDFMTGWERPASATAGLDERVAAGHDAANIMQARGIINARKAAQYLDKKGLPSGGLGGPGEMSDEELEALSRKRRLAWREDRIRDMRKKVGEAETVRGRTAAYWRLLQTYAEYSQLGEKGRGYVLNKVREVSAEPNPNKKVGPLQDIAQFWGKHGTVTGKDTDDYKELTKAFERARDKGADLRKIKREKISNRISGKGLDFPGKKNLARVGKRNAISDELIARMEALHTSPGSAPGGDIGTELTDSEVFKQIEANIDLYNDVLYQGRQAAESKGWIKKYIRNMDKKIKAATPKGSKDHWKLKDMREGRKNAFTSLSEVESTLNDVYGLSRKKGKLFDIRLHLNSLGYTKTWEKQNAESFNAEKQDNLLESLRLANMRNTVLERQFGALNSLPPWMGAYANGGIAMVGERGPELAHLPSGTRVHGAGETQRMLQGSGGVVIENMSVTVYEDEDRVVVKMDDQEFEARLDRVNRKKSRGVGAVPGRGGYYR
jgi:TP901 family phage tail tape measure protein